VCTRLSLPLPESLETRLREEGVHKSGLADTKLTGTGGATTGLSKERP